MRLSKLKFSLLLVSILLISCSRGPEKREYQIMPDMTRSYAHEAQEEKLNEKGEHTGESVMRKPAKGSIPRGFEPYLLDKDDFDGAKALINPLEPTKDILVKGRKFYNINCTPCHGKFGAGDGAVITKATLNQRMPKPPELYGKSSLSLTDGEIFHIITMGRGNMPSYANRMDRETRWAIVNYVRLIQDIKTDKIKTN